MSEVILSDAEREAIEVLADYAVPHRTRCPVCKRRVNAPRQDDSPTTRQMRITLPAERMESVEEAFDAMQEVAGIDPYSYPRGLLLEALLVLGGQHREEIARYFRGED